MILGLLHGGFGHMGFAGLLLFVLLLVGFFSLLNWLVRREEK
jgi:hypothetical protein